MRTVTEWIGRTDDTKIPPRVRARVFLAHDGKCHITGRRIMPADYWECDHIIALANGGEHRETNLAPALRDAHRIKTRSDVKLKAKTARIRNRHLGIRKSQSRPMPGTKASGIRKRMDGTIENWMADPRQVRRYVRRTEHS